MPKLKPGADGQMEYHYTTGVWQNWIGEQGTSVDKWHEPKSCAEVRSILEASGTSRVRAVGSGHSTSSVARPDDILIDLKNMKKKLPTSSFYAEPRGLKEGQKLFRFEAGTTVKELNKHLDNARLALANMGSYDGQKFIGAACTGTHGSGLTWGPLADSVVSIEMFTVERDHDGNRVVRLKRIEPHDGITNPERFGADASEEDMDLVVDRDLFNACVVSMGCFGIVCAVTLKVVPAYWLQEVRQQGAWSKLKHKLIEKAREDGHMDVWILPNRVPNADDNPCLTLRRTKCDSETGDPPERKDLEGSNFIGWVVKNFGSTFVGKTLSGHPAWFSRNIAGYFDGEDGSVFKSVSHDVYVIGAGEGVKATSNEIHVPLERAVDAVDVILKLARENEDDDLFHTSPIGVRFIAASDHWLSMDYGRESCSIEVPLIVGTKGAETIMRKIENALFDMGGRPHWGQVNDVTERKARELYPRFGDWVDYYRRFNRYGTFENKFTKQLGLPSDVTREAG